MVTFLRLAVLFFCIAISGYGFGQSAVTLQEGLNGYVGSSDTDVWMGMSDSQPEGADTTLVLRSPNNVGLVRFPIFANEGGPVPDGATIVSATLSLYKFNGPDSVFDVRRLLRSWQEVEATWNLAAAGTPWEIAGVQGAADVVATPESQGSIGTSEGWLDFDVTAGVQEFAGGTANYGWKISYVSGTQDPKGFISRNHPSQPTLRPKLTITYEPPAPPCTSGPYGGTPAQVPGTFQAENFDCGGEGVGYHDADTINDGGEHRPNEAVDIFLSPGSPNHVVKNFATGEWLAYTIDVQTAGNYDLKLRTATQLSGTAFHVEIDGVDVTGTIVAPNTGGWEAYDWFDAKTNVSLAAGVHQLKIVSEQQWVGVDAIQISASAGGSSTPYGGTPAAVPGIIQAENFDEGGEGVAYHDTDAINDGGQHRPTEGVDVFTSSGAPGGYVIKNFATGEWMTYTVNVQADGNYDFRLRTATQLSGTAFHIEVDGVDVTGTVTVPNTGGWETYAWFVAKTGVPLTEGVHDFKIVSEQEWFGIDAIEVLSAGSGGGGGENPPGLIFRSGFEGTTRVEGPYSAVADCWSTGCWQYIVGEDAGFTWLPQIWGGSHARIQARTGGGSPTPETLGNWISNEVRSGVGRNGSKAFYSEIKQSGGDFHQTPYIIFPDDEPEGAPLYVSFWVKLQEDLAAKMSEDGAWRAIFEIKSAEPLDWRFIVFAKGSSNGVPFFDVVADTCPSSACELWSRSGGPVPIGEWFQLEVFWRRTTDSSGRVWVAVNGDVIADEPGSHMGANNHPINRIFLLNLYSGSSLPIYQWVDDVQIWDHIPTAAERAWTATP